MAYGGKREQSGNIDQQTASSSATNNTTKTSLDASRICLIISQLISYLCIIYNIEVICICSFTIVFVSNLVYFLIYPFYPLSLHLMLRIIFNLNLLTTFINFKMDLLTHQMFVIIFIVFDEFISFSFYLSIRPYELFIILFFHRNFVAV